MTVAAMMHDGSLSLLRVCWVISSSVHKSKSAGVTKRYQLTTMISLDFVHKHTKSSMIAPLS